MAKNKIYYDAAEIAEMLDVSVSKAYEIIRRLNDELITKGYIIIQGKISKVYFQERWYGGTNNSAAG